MVKIGVIGVGKWGKNHLRSLATLSCDLVAIADVDPAQKKLAKEYGISFFEDYKQLIEHVDAVTVTTPTDTHYTIVRECLKAGKHVLVEKPIASTSAQSKQLVALAQKNRCILSVGYLFRFNNAITKVQELIKNIGEIQYITCRYIHSTKPPRRDAGAILNLAVHPLDIINFITGKKPRRVAAQKKNLLSKELEDSAVLLLDYKDFFATIEVSCTHPEKKRDMWIIAEKEKLYVDYFSQTIARYPLTVTYEKVEGGEPLQEPLVPNEPLKDELEYFINLVQKAQTSDAATLSNKGKEDPSTILACELSIKSAEAGKEMMIP